MKPFYTKTVTIFNYSPGSDVLDEETYYATVLHNVRLLEAAARETVTDEVKEADKARLHIRLDQLGAINYVQPIVYNSLQDKTNYFTLCQDKDFFAVGDLSGVTVTDNFFKYMKEHYDSVYMVSSVDKFDLIPHLEVGGR